MTSWSSSGRSDTIRPSLEDAASGVSAHVCGDVLAMSELVSPNRSSTYRERYCGEAPDHGAD